MSRPKDGPMPHIEVDDPEAAFHKFEDFARRVLAVPKEVIDKKLARERANRARKKSRK